MADFYFEENAQKYGKKQSGFQKPALIAACLFLVYCSITLEDTSGQIMCFIMLLILLSNLRSSFNLFDKLASSPSDEKWEISVSEHELRWESPESFVGTLNEISFSCALSDIDKVQHSYSSFDENLPYRFLLKDGKDIRPGVNSSINMDELTKVLEKNGIYYERVNDFDR
jgi:hypothetical protein